MAIIEVEMTESKSGLSIFRTTRLMQNIYFSPNFSNGFLCTQLFLQLVAMLVLVLLLLFMLVLLLLFMLVLLLLFPLDCNL